MGDRPGYAKGWIMRRYREVLAERDFRRLWLGASVSLLGDGMTLVALAWIVLGRAGGTGRLGLLMVCYTAPVLAGGLLVGPLLDRFDKRRLLAADSLIRGACVASVPIVALLGMSAPWLVFVVAGTYGLLKMVPLAGFPAILPDLVAAERLDAANALESVSFSAAGIAGPALAGVLIGFIGAPGVLLIDAATFLAFAVAAATIAHPPRPGDELAPRRRDRSTASLRDPALVLTTLAFMTFNIAEGMLLVVLPWLAKTRLRDGALLLGLLLATLAAGELIGAMLAGVRRRDTRPLRAIGTAQVAAGVGFLGLLTVPYVLPMAAGLLLVGLLSAPMTVWAQTLRMQRVPPRLRGRTFARLRTLMQATPPIGAACVTPLLDGGRLGSAALVMAALAGLPGLILIGADRGVRLTPARSEGV
jgi:MFS family permease